MFALTGRVRRRMPTQVWGKGPVMIEFYCAYCRGTIKVRDEMAGRRGKCPKCAAVNTVPQPKASQEKLVLPHDAESGGSSILLTDFVEYPDASEPQTHGSSILFDLPEPEPISDEEPAGGSPAAIGAGVRAADRKARRPMPPAVKYAILAGMVPVVALVAWLFLRDTWERDNKNRIVTLEKQADALHYEERLEEAVRKYQALFDLVRDRKIKDQGLRIVLRKAREDYGFARKKLAERAAGEYFATHQDAIAALQSKGDAAAKAQQHPQAFEHYQKAVDLIKKSSHIAGKLAETEAEIRKRQQVVRGRWQKQLLARLGRMASQAEAALEEEKFAEAEKHYDAMIDLEQKRRHLRTQKIAELIDTAQATLDRIPRLEKDARRREARARRRRKRGGRRRRPATEPAKG